MFSIESLFFSFLSHLEYEKQPKPEPNLSGHIIWPSVSYQVSAKLETATEAIAVAKLHK